MTHAGERPKGRADSPTDEVRGLVLLPASHQATKPELAVTFLDVRAGSRQGQEAIVRQLDGLVAATMRSIQALEGKLTAEEQDRILDSIEKAKKARADGGLDELRRRLADMEQAAGIIGQAMLRP